MNRVRRGTDKGGWRPHVQYYHMRDGRNGIFFWALWEPKRLSMAAAAGGWVGGWMDTNARAVALLFARAKRAPSCGERGFASIAVFNEQLDRFLVYKSIISLLYLGSNSDDPWLVLAEADIPGSLTRGPIPGQSARDENDLRLVHESTLTLFVIMQQQKGPHAKRFPKAPSFRSKLFRCQCCAE